jgi:hypothetical protein
MARAKENRCQKETVTRPGLIVNERRNCSIESAIENYGHVKLLHLNNRLQYLLAITKLNSVFETLDSEPAAVSSFAPCTERIEDAAR